LDLTGGDLLTLSGAPDEVERKRADEKKRPGDVSR
jgi:hypothetical protein